MSKETDVKLRMEMLPRHKDVNWLLQECVTALQLAQQDPTNSDKRQYIESALYFYGCAYFRIKQVEPDANPLIDRLLHGDDKCMGVIQKIMRKVDTDDKILKGYISTAFDNMYRDYERALTHSKHWAMESLDKPIGDSERTLLDTIQLRDTEEAIPFLPEEKLLRHIDNLPERCRKPILMLADGASYNDIVQQLGLPMNTVKTNIYFGRAKLKQSLLLSGELDARTQAFVQNDEGRAR